MKQEEFRDTRSLVKLENITRRVRHPKATPYSGIKAILGEMMSVIDMNPMKIKLVAAQIVERWKREYEGCAACSKTVQKRVYDASLVLKTVGLIEVSRKQIYVNELSQKMEGIKARHLR